MTIPTALAEEIKNNVLSNAKSRKIYHTLKGIELLETSNVVIGLLGIWVVRGKGEYG